ncbi:MAG TPA: hypothetical protein VMM78_12395 [Thermomicrobiales bacterium]|nr:hypothetical protein [Thermomicrobiales bacterium]
MSARLSVRFDRLDVRRMYGIDASFVVDGLCSGVNVIHGPNASGKTTLTHALLTLLWPSSPMSPQAVVAGAFEFDGARWLVEYDNGGKRCQRDGVDADHPIVAADSERYLLALHVLLAADNRSFAEAILRESAGGYDVGAAIQALKLTQRPSAPQRLKGLRDQATQDRQAALAAQQRLLDEERTLEGLNRELDEAREADRKVATLQKALDCRLARSARDDTLAQLTTFPDVMERLSGDERETLRDLRLRQEEARAAIAAESQQMSDAVDRQRRARLDERVPGGLVAALRERCSELQDITSATRAAETRRDDASVQLETARRSLGALADDSRLAGLGVVEFDQLAELAQRHATVRAQLAALEALHTWLGPIASSQPLDPEERRRLDAGIHALDQWLRHERAEAPAGKANQRRTLLLIAGIAVIVQSIVLGIVAHPAALILVVTGAWLVYVALKQGRSRSASEATSATELVRAEYERLQLDAPSTWHSAEVELLIETLAQQQRSRALDEEKRQRWDYVADERVALQARSAEAQAEIDAAATRFGAAPGRDPASLYVLASNLVQWQHARDRLNGTAAEIAALRTRLAATFDELNATLASYDYATVAKQAEALGCIEDLTQRERDWNEAQASHERSTRLLREQLRPQLERREADIHAFFERLDMNEEDEHQLTGLLDQLEAYRLAREASQRARLECERAEQALGDDGHLADEAATEIERRLEDAREHSAEQDEIRDEIAAVTARVAEAKTKHDLERALAAEQMHGEQLAEAREQAYAQVAGWSIADFVREETRDNDRPLVFHRARELFVKITHGRYRLELSDTEPPAFRAIDNVTGAGHALHELSSGTRLQLLLAVRVAFVEHQEQGVMLPLIFDETLGNSDEQRARAIIDATIEIAGSGRQVLYLTAQHDEVRKWQAVMSQHPEVPFRLLDLAEIRDLADWERLPPVAHVEWPVITIPEPDGLSHDDYRELLRVPGIDPRAESDGGLHLWHLIDDTHALHRLLSLHIETWGQLRAMADLGGADLLDGQEQIVRRCHARADVIKEACACFRAGRGRPVDRAVIIECGVITPVFIDRVAALARRVDGNAQSLIAALDRGEISHFRGAMRNDLQRFLEEGGYLASDRPLTIDEARTRVVAAASSDLHDGRVTVEFIRDTLEAVWSHDSPEWSGEDEAGALDV